MTWFLRSIFILFVLTAIGVLAGGVFLIVQRQTGTRARATVAECHLVTGGGGHATDECTGSWIVGGSLLAGGHVVVGDIQGAERRDIGKTLDVTVRGGTAYTRGLGLPIGLTAGGLIGAVGLGWLTVKTWSPVVRTPNTRTSSSRPTSSVVTTTKE
jgi:hypothetical protein